MENELDDYWDKVKNSTGKDQIKIFVNYCTYLIRLKDEGKLSEEDAAYKMVGTIQFDNLTDSPECDAIFDAAGTAELPRNLFYAQPMGEWDEKTANHIKQKEWEEVVSAVRNAENMLL